MKLYFISIIVITTKFNILFCYSGARVFSNDEAQPASTSGKTDSKKKSYTDVSPTTPPSGTKSPSTPNKDASADKKPKIFEDGSLDYDGKSHLWGTLRNCVGVLPEELSL